MTNRSKQIGTAGESAVRDYLRVNGFYGCERRALNGTHDLGDLTGIGPLVVEVKAGAAAARASDAQVRAWMVETEVERMNADADFGLLVMKRAGIGPARAGDWWCVMPTWQFLALHGHHRSNSNLPVRMHLSTAVLVLRAAGYGDALTETAAA
jgi:hypothetical protein